MNIIFMFLHTFFYCFYDFYCVYLSAFISACLFHASMGHVAELNKRMDENKWIWIVSYRFEQDIRYGIEKEKQLRKLGGRQWLEAGVDTAAKQQTLIDVGATRPSRARRRRQRRRRLNVSTLARAWSACRRRATTAKCFRLDQQPAAAASLHSCRTSRLSSVSEAGPFVTARRQRVNAIASSP